MGPIRELLLGNLGGALTRANQPVFGEAEQASFLNALNDTTKNAFGKISSNLARVGALDSGRAESAATNAELFRSEQIGKFASELPFREREAQFAQLLPLLQAGLGFVGRGNQTVEQTGSENFDTTQEFDQETTGRGPGFLRNLAGGLGGFLGQQEQRNEFNNLLDRFFPRNPFGSGNLGDFVDPKLPDISGTPVPIFGGPGSNQAFLDPTNRPRGIGNLL